MVSWSSAMQSCWVSSKSLLTAPTAEQVAQVVLRVVICNTDTVGLFDTCLGIW